jgi:hypothetical protein
MYIVNIKFASKFLVIKLLLSKIFWIYYHILNIKHEFYMNFDNTTNFFNQIC